eukprot:1984940-Pleurochrysis_carterae.AAC.2
MISCIEISLVSHSRMRLSNGLTKGEPRIACVLTMWSSNSPWMSSSARRMYVPVSRYSMQSNSTGRHSPSILSRAFSSDISFEAMSLCSWISSSFSSSFCSIMDASVENCDGCTEKPIAVCSAFQ